MREIEWKEIGRIGRGGGGGGVEPFRGGISEIWNQTYQFVFVHLTYH
jgi:hypothetical protein